MRAGNASDGATSQRRRVPDWRLRSLSHARTHARTCARQTAAASRWAVAYIVAFGRPAFCRVRHSQSSCAGAHGESGRSCKGSGGSEGPHQAEEEVQESQCHWQSAQECWVGCKVHHKDASCQEIAGRLDERSLKGLLSTSCLMPS
eukprot:2251772-Pleurochrysis_carterae.AAC.5